MLECCGCERDRVDYCHKVRALPGGFEFWRIYSRWVESLCIHSLTLAATNSRLIYFHSLTLAATVHGSRSRPHQDVVHRPLNIIERAKSEIRPTRQVSSIVNP